MTRGPCHWWKKMMCRCANGGCGTEDKHCPAFTSRFPTKVSAEDKDAQLAQIVGIDFYAQACKALAVHSPFDLEDGQKKSSAVAATLPGVLASCLSKHSDSRKRHRRSRLRLSSDTKKNKSSSRQEKPRGSTVWTETEDYFRELRVDDIERLNEVHSFTGDRFITIPYIGNNTNETNNRISGVVVSGEEHYGSHFIEVDGVGGYEVAQNPQEDDTASSLPQYSTGVEWLLGSRSKIYLTTERPSKKRKVLDGEAALEKLFVARPVKDQGPSTCCDYCSLGDTGNQLNRLIVCTSCSVAVHQRCYGVQQVDEADYWLCSWCRLKRNEDESSDSHCLLCPQQGGALKPVRKRGSGNDVGGLIEFAHLFCCQWMPEVYIEDTKSMEPIINIEGINETQKKLICYLCKVKYGACIRCSYGSCPTSFHPVCAREARHRMEIWGKFGCDDVELRAFCSMHSECPKDHSQLAESLSVGVGSPPDILARQSLSPIINEPLKLNLGQRTSKKSSSHTEATDTETGGLGGSAAFEDGLLDIRSNPKHQIECIVGSEAKCSSTVKDVKSSDSNFTLLLKKKKLKLKVMSTCISKAEKESGVENAGRASENNVGSSPVKLAAAPQSRTKGNIRVLKDNSLILSLKRTSEDEVVMGEDKNAGLVHEDWNFRCEESSPDAREKMLVESCQASDQLTGDLTKGSSSSHNGRGQVDDTVFSKCGTRVASSLGGHDCSVALNENLASISTAALTGSYVHPLILVRNQTLSEINADEDDGSNTKCIHSSTSDASGACFNHQGQTDTKLISIINMSPTDEVEGQLVYYQHQLLRNGTVKKHLSDGLISKVLECLPEEIEAQRKQNWDAVFVSLYLSELREVKKQGRKERRHKEAQAVLAAATAAAAASSRLSSFRKDAVDESAHHENMLKIKPFGGRSTPNAQVPRARAAHPKLSVTWSSPEKNFESSSSALEHNMNSRVCDVCRRAETILNPIIVCSSCKVAVHINCYRSVKDSTGPWFCEFCEDLQSSGSRRVSPLSYMEKPSVAECGLCGGTTGAFRKSTDGQWVHAFCAEWVLESTFRRGQVKPIEGMETISRANELCLVCGRNVGVCIKCNYGHCQSAFHPSCGIMAGFFMNVRNIGGKVQHKAYCEKHSLAERTKAETQKHGVEEWNSLKKVRVELERLRLICERIIRREKLKRELVICSHDMLRCNREYIPRSIRTYAGFVSPDVSSESATTSLRGYTNSYKSCSETIQRSDDDSTVAGKRRIRFPMDNDQKTDDSSTSQIFTQTPTARPILAGKQIPHRKHMEIFSKEVVMTSDQASMRNQRLPKGFVYVPIRCLPNEEETIAAATTTTAAVAVASSEENSGEGA